MKKLKLGSLFSGSGGFELAGVLHGIEPVWASEIEPFPIRVTKERFPNMKHLGSVTDINGAEIEPVDIITFGSPCQDLSVAGKQLGIHDGERSNLFFEAIRIIKEMREHDRATGRADVDLRPRFAVWENVPGAFSSNKGKDFQAVLQAFCEIGGGTNHIVPMPPANKWLHFGTIVGDGWSLAWRIYDAQFWGVPQRRKRIYLIADFGSERAGEILSECESVRGDSAESGEAREGTAANVEGSAGRSDYACGWLIPWEESAFAWTYRGREGCCNVEMQKDVSYCLREPTGGGSQPNVCYPAAFMGGHGAKARSIAYCEDGSTPKLKSTLSGGNTVPDVVYPINTMVAARGGKDDMRTCFGVGEPNDPQFTISAAHEHGVCYALEGNTVDRTSGKNGKGYCWDVSPTLNTQDKHAVTYAIEGNGQRDSHQGDGYAETDKMYTLNTIEHHAVAYAIDQQRGKGGANYQTDVAPTLYSDSHGTPHAVVCLNDQVGSMMDVSDKAATLRAQEHGHQPVVCFRKSSKPRADGSGERWVEDGKTNTLNTFEFHSEVRTPEVIAIDCRNMCANEELSATLQAKNQGGHSLNFINPVCYRQDGFAGYSEGVGTLKASGGDMGGGYGKHRR